MVKYLTEKGAKIDVADKKNQTAMDIAANYQLSANPGAPSTNSSVIEYRKIVEYLMQKLNVIFLKAAHRQDFKKMQELIGKINCKNTVLLFASKNGRLEVVKFLISKGAEIEAKSKNLHKTPLHHAAGSGYIDIVKFLHKKGADINAKDYAGKTPLDLAVERKSVSVANYLMENALIFSMRTFLKKIL